MEIKFKPKVEGVSGEITIDMPIYVERLKTIQKINNSDDKIQLAIDLVEEVSKLVKKVDITIHGEDGDLKVNSMDALGCYDKGVEVINSLGQCYSEGIPLGKSKTT